jgi:hypothetical protein
MPTAASADPKTANVLPDRPVKLTATAKPGYIFSHWQGGPANAVELGNVITFLMSAQPVGPVTAVFVENPFAGSASASHSFYGLIHPIDETPSSNVTQGFVTGTLVPASGAFTGKVSIDGLTQSFVATFFGDGSGLFTVGKQKLPELNFANRALTLSFEAGKVIATVEHQTAGSSQGEAHRGSYGPTHKIPATGDPLKVGFYTVVFPSKIQSPGSDQSLYPQGTGYGTVTLTSAGIVTLAGTLADGSVHTASSAVVRERESPLFAQLVTPGAAASNKGGSFGGVITFDATRENTDLSGTDLRWIRPAVDELIGTSAAAKARQLYTSGWAGPGIQVDALGALYDKSVKIQAALELDAPTGAPALTGNSSLLFSGGRLTGDITVAAFNINGSVATKIPKNNSAFTLSLTQSSGLFTGTFTPNWANPAAAKPTFKGILLQKGTSKGGYGFSISNALNDLDPESSNVSLGPP